MCWSKNLNGFSAYWAAVVPAFNPVFEAFCMEIMPVIATKLCDLICLIIFFKANDTNILVLKDVWVISNSVKRMDESLAL